MNPDIADVHLNALLTNVSVGYTPAGFFASGVFPLVPVTKQTDVYATYDKSYWARDLGAAGAAPTGSAQALVRSPGTRARTVGYKVNKDQTYYCENFALGMEIPDELRGNADSVFDLDRDATVLLQSRLNLRFDRRFAADFLTSNVWSALTVGTKWSDYAASTPIEDIRAGLDALRKNTLGMVTGGGTRLLMGCLVERRLLDHPDLIERFKYGASAGQPALVTHNLLAQLLGVDEIKVIKSVYTDAEEGTAEASVTYSDIADDDVLLYWTPPSAARLAPSAGYLFNWRPLTGGGMFFVRKGREDRDRLDWIEVHAYLDWVATHGSSGLYNADAVD